MTFVNAPWHVHEDLFASSESSFSSASQDAPPECAKSAKPLRETNGRALQAHASGKSSASSPRCAHVPHKDKPPQVVAKRNARERRRVQAVNGAFVRLRKAVPFENNRGKRVSKVKTLQYAIDYIQKLQDLLSDYDNSQNVQFYYNYYPSPPDTNFSTSDYSLNDFGDTFDLGY